MAVDMRHLNYLYHEKYGLRPINRHSLILLVGGIIYAAYGFTLHFWSADGPRAAPIRHALDLFPLEFWAWAFILVGFGAMISGRWPAFHDRWGYTVLSAYSGTWAALYLTGLFFQGNTIAESGGLITWTAITFLWWAVAGLVSPESTIIVTTSGVDNVGEL